MTFLDFFAGIGGARLGLELAGFKCIGFCEKDKYAIKSYRAMFDTERRVVFG
jgi:DNA (cytosine-5)-methyltransferase 1